jgi:hypothetical protein
VALTTAGHPSRESINLFFDGAQVSRGVVRGTWNISADSRARSRSRNAIAKPGRLARVSPSTASGEMVMSMQVTRVLGWVVIAHGLAHAVLPLRGATAPAFLVGDWIPVGLYMVTMVGFVAAGLGILGAKPMDRAISPLLVLSAGLSIVAVVRMGDPTLWLGGVFDVALMGVGLWRAAAGWPEHPSHGRVWHAVGLVCAVGFLTYVAVAATLWPWHRTWGSTRSEILMPLPGDEDVRRPALEIQHAVTIDAPPSRVWPWLMQLGQDRAGFYSYDWLERAFLVDIRNVPSVRPEWQTREVGDLVRATQPSYLRGMLGRNLGWRVARIDPGYAMVLENWGAFVLLPTEDGRTRFVIRATISSPEIPVWASALEFMTFELPHFIMERRMMLTIKALAEQNIAQSASTH